jgi:hypothetical protein
MSRAVAKLALGLGALALGVLCAEGALSLFLESSLARLGRGRAWLERLEAQDPAADPARLRAAARALGPYRAAIDPLVGITLRPASAFTYLDEEIRTDALGLRARSRPSLGPEAFRIVLLGDSVAYGLGLPQEQSLAAQLEDALAATRTPGARPIECHAVALPGWNTRNAVRFLLDHLGVLAPDLVLYVPVENDLDDGYGVSETGQRRRAPDPAVPAPLCAVAPPFDLFRTLGRERFGPRELARREREAELEHWALFAGATGEARWRYDDACAQLALLAQRLARRGAGLALAPYHAHAPARALLARLVERGLELPVLALLDEFRHADGLGKNPHPNAETTRALAAWAAEGLLAAGLVPAGDARALPPPPERFTGRRAVGLGPDELVRWRRAFEAERRAAFEARVEPALLRGVSQIYGGLNADGTLGPRTRLVLPPGRRLVLELAGEVEAPGLYPLGVVVAIDGVELGRVLVPAHGERMRAELALPSTARQLPFEVELQPEDWAFARVLERRAAAAATLVAVESVP